MLIIQWIVVSVAVYAFCRVFSQFYSRTISAVEFILWGCFWVFVGFCVWLPGITQCFAKILGVGRGADAVFYLGLVGLSYAFFRLYLKNRDLEQSITHIVRKLAIDEQKYSNAEDR